MTESVVDPGAVQISDTQPSQYGQMLSRLRDGAPGRVLATLQAVSTITGVLALVTEVQRPATASIDASVLASIACAAQSANVGIAAAGALIRNSPAADLSTLGGPTANAARIVATVVPGDYEHAATDSLTFAAGILGLGESIYDDLTGARRRDPQPGGHELHLELPDAWTVLGADEAARRDEHSTSGRTTHLHDNRPLTKPDLVASLRGLTQTDDQVEIVIASLVAWSYATGTVTPEATLTRRGRVMTNVETSPGISADYYVLTLPVLSSDGTVTTLLTFSTPNLYRTKPLDEAFRSIWATASVATIGGGAA